MSAAGGSAALVLSGHEGGGGRSVDGSYIHRVTASCKQTNKDHETLTFNIGAKTAR